jgi:hypothetical protein
MKKNELVQKNTASIPTPSGYKSIELWQGFVSPENISRLAGDEGSKPMLLVSNLNRNFDRLGLMKSVFNDFKIDLEALSKKPAIDLVKSMGIWVTDILPKESPISRIICWEGFEDQGRDLKKTFHKKAFEQGLVDIFSTIGLIHAKWPGEKAQSLFSVLIGTGPMGFSPTDVSNCIISAAQETFPSLPAFNRLFLLECEEAKVEEFKDEMDKSLGRTSINIENDSAIEQMKLVAKRILDIVVHKAFLLKHKEVQLIVECCHETQKMIKAEKTSVKVKAELVTRWMLSGRVLSEFVIAHSLDKNSLKRWKENKEAWLSILGKERAKSGSNAHFDKIEALGDQFLSELPSVNIVEGLNYSTKIQMWMIQNLHLLRAYGNSVAHFGESNKIPIGFGQEDLLIVMSSILRTLEYISKHPIPIKLHN